MRQGVMGNASIFARELGAPHFWCSPTTVMVLLLVFMHLTCDLFAFAIAKFLFY